MKNTAGKRIRELRTALGLSQEKFAKECDISMSTVSKAELGDIPVTYDVIEKICYRWGTHDEWLREGKGEMSFTKEKKSGNIYQDALYKELKEEKESWKQKFEQLFDAVIKGGSLGKLKAINIAGRSKKLDRLLVVRDK